MELDLDLDLKPGHSHPKAARASAGSAKIDFLANLGRTGSRRPTTTRCPRPLVLCPAPHCPIPIPVAIPNPISNPSPPAPAPEPPVILAVMDMVEARAVFVPEILVDYADILRLTIKM